MRRFTLTAVLCILALQMAPAQHKPYLEDLPYYLENTSVFEQNQEPGRAFHIPSHNLSLNGKWRFQYFESPYDVPKDFFNPSFNDRKWPFIEVPSNWEMQGFGQAVFRNVSAPFQVTMPESRLAQYRRILEDPNATEQQKRMATMRLGGAPNAFAVQMPNVPMDFNPTGAYRTSFNLPSAWKGEQVFLRFEKVASGSFVWVNGRQVGYNEGAQEPSEYNITKYLKPGKNTVAVMVVKYCDGYYLEGQDYWRLAGIFDDVTVLAVPDTRIRDWQVITDFDATFTDSDLSVAVDLQSFTRPASGYSLTAEVSDGGRAVATMQESGISVAAGSQRTVRFQAKVKAPKKWSSETPDLYDLKMTLKDASGRVVDEVTKRVGFKKTEIRDGVFYLNGQPLKISAVNSHMQHPVLGHAMTEEIIRKDFEILKQFNFNGVRTSHYPPVNEYLDLADEYGIFIIDETGDEAHATEYVSDMPEFTEMYRERVQRMVLRDRNHACIIIWSAGNESGEGNNITEVVKEGKSLDPTRYWMYGGNASKHPAEDIVGPRYGSPLELELGYGLDKKDMRPSFMDEYLSVAGNGGGGVDDYWDAIYTHPKSMGGALWDFVSVGLDEPVRALKDKSGNNVPAHIMGRARLVKGPTGNAIDFNKQDQWVQVYRADAVEISGDKLTLTLDIMPRHYNASGGYLITKGNNQFGLKQQGADKLDFYIDNGTRQVLTADLPADWEGKWHNVTATYDGTAMKIFIDKREVASMPMTGSIRNLPLSLCIGRSEEALGQDTNVYICDAQIDNVGVFSVALSPASLDKSKAALWLDFEEETNEGTFWTYGIGARTYGCIWPDRTVQPEMWQLKKATQPLSFKLIDPARGTVEVWNRNHFLNASYYKTTWALTADADTVAKGVISLDVAPLSRKVVRIPLVRPEPVPGKEYRLTFSSVLTKDEIWASAGHEVSWDQFELKAWNVPAAPKPAPEGKVRMTTDNNFVTVAGNGFEYRFSATSGALVSAVIDGKETLREPLRLNVWRAPLANELDGWNGRGAGNARVSGYGSIGHSMVLAAHYYSAGLDRIAFVPIYVRAREAGEDVIIDVRDIAQFGAGTGRYTQLDAYISGYAYDGFDETYSWQVSPDGTLTFHHKVNPQGQMPQWLPRLGLTTSLDKSMTQIEWYGRGPQASYPDRKSGYRMGIWKTDVDAMYEPYLIPQDYGLRTDNRWVRITNESGTGLQFSMDEPFAFNAYDCTTDNLTKAVYQYQLERGGDVTLNLDYVTSGVGCTARGIFDAYRAYPAGYERTVTIQPVRK
ncbi:MAG: DUF4981 domain-containing protein [Bacteroidales bacterium]|nr:DUF4981 domain-containing protein [Bacteroidales bacterium]